MLVGSSRFIHGPREAADRKARELAQEFGVDRLCWEITDHPEDSFSRRFTPGTPEFDAIRRETWDDSNLGNAIPGATPRARIDVRPIVPGLPLVGARRRPLTVRTRVHNLSRRAFPITGSQGRRIVRLGAQLCDAQGALLNLDYARADLPRPLEGGSTADIAIHLKELPDPGRYTLKFDLVCEGVDWFEKCGSPVTTQPLWVL